MICNNSIPKSPYPRTPSPRTSASDGVVLSQIGNINRPIIKKRLPNDVRRVVERFLTTRRLVRIVVLVIYRRRSCTAIPLDFVFACRLCSAHSIKSVSYGGLVTEAIEGIVDDWEAVRSI
jgi:hypothetical protein